MGVLHKYKQYDGIKTETIKLGKGKYEGLNRIDLSIGMVYNTINQLPTVLNDKFVLI